MVIFTESMKKKQLFKCTNCFLIFSIHEKSEQTQLGSEDCKTSKNSDKGLSIT